MTVGYLVRSLILTLAITLGGTAAFAGPSMLFDPVTGEVLSQDRAGEPWYPASLTKLMGKGEAQARRELMELRGDAVEVDV